MLVPTTSPLPKISQRVLCKIILKSSSQHDAPKSAGERFQEACVCVCVFVSTSEGFEEGRRLSVCVCVCVSARQELVSPRHRQIIGD